jgi:hypothetical protein
MTNGTGQEASSNRLESHATHVDRDASEESVTICTEHPPLIPTGEYLAFGVGFLVMRINKMLKLRVDWDVQVPVPDGPDGTVLLRISRFYKLRGKGPRKLEAGPSSDLRREYILLFGRSPSRRGKIDPRMFIGVAARVEVRTVTHDFRQRELPAAAQYSVINRVIEHIAGNRPS